MTNDAITYLITYERTDGKRASFHFWRECYIVSGVFGGKYKERVFKSRGKAIHYMELNGFRDITLPRPPKENCI